MNDSDLRQRGDGHEEDLLHPGDDRSTARGDLPESALLVLTDPFALHVLARIEANRASDEARVWRAVL